MRWRVLLPPTKAAANHDLFPTGRPTPGRSLAVMDSTSSADDLDSALDRLGIQPGERAVASLALVKGDAGWQIAAGCVLFGSTEMCDQSWLGWHEAQTGEPSPVAVYGIDPTRWATVDLDHAGWRLRRFSLAGNDAIDMLRLWAQTDMLVDGAGAGADVNAVLGYPTASRVALSHGSGSMGALSVFAERPLTGWLHSDVMLDPPMPIPRDWRLTPTAPECDAPFWLLGFGSTQEPSGLLIGRVRSDAWIIEIRGERPSFEDFTITLGLDPDQTSLRDLVIDLEEADSDGNLFAARRVRLADLALPSHGATRYDLTLPSAGKGVTRRVRLYGLDGRLLDGADNVHLAESIQVSIRSISDETDPSNRQATVVQVGDSTPPTRARRVTAVERADRRYAELLEGGLPGRIIAGGARGSDLLHEHLRAARGELLVIDRYFGQLNSLWQVLDSVTVGIKVLTATKAESFSLPSYVAPNAASLEVRRASHKLFHDRSYTWHGGGLSVGASINGLDSGAMYLVDVLEPFVAESLSAQFRAWWTHAQPL